MRASRIISDAAGCSLPVHLPVRRIVSLVPSLTETLFEIGAGDVVAGVSDFCRHPCERIAALPKVGGPKNPDANAIAGLQPDLVLMDYDENRRADYESLVQRFPVYVSNVRKVADVPPLLCHLGAITGCGQRANAIAADLESRLQMADASPRAQRATAVVLLWREPLVTAGGETYITDLLRIVGIENAFASVVGRYPVISESRIAARNPHWVLFPSEPYGWRMSEIEALQNRWLRGGCTAAPQPIDGEMLGWFGTRTLSALQYAVPEWHRKLVAPFQVQSTV